MNPSQASRSSINHRPTSKSFLELKNLYEDDLLKLSPGFQRQSVWAERDRVKLIDSILQNYPLPAIFLYARKHNGDEVYDVIDGKQRIESVLRFMGSIRGGKFKAKVQLPGSDNVEAVDWAMLNRRNMQHLIHAYQIPVIMVDGDLGDIIDIFIRINSTGKALTPQEKRSAQYYNSSLLKTAGAMAKRYEPYFLKQGILSTMQISRMKSVELICELILTLDKGDVLNKKAALDRVMATSMDARSLANAKAKVTKALNRVERMFPQLKTTRFSQLSDYYTLVALIGKYEEEGFILTNAKRNDQAWALLKKFGSEVDNVREAQKKVKGARPDQALYRDYLITVSQMTDDVNQRRKREQILDGVLRNLFERKDEKRTFSKEQRRLLWNNENKAICSKCKRPINWNDLSMDHVLAHSRGGKTTMKNAQPMHKNCNSSKGAR